jgi:hypothetical protein
MKRLTLNCAAVLVAALMVASCGDDDDSATTDAGADAGPDGATGSGSGGQGDDNTPPTMTGGTGGRQGNMMVPPPVKCGGITCPVPLRNEFNLLANFAAMAGFPLPAGGAGILPTACCTTQQVCGLIVQGEGCVPPPKRDPRCPNVTVLGVTAPGCCNETTGMCGANGAQTGQGCVDVSAIVGLLGGTPTTQTRCIMPDGGMMTPDSGHPHEDGGSEDAGN